MKKPLVSVQMNCHNCEKFLREALDSVYSQTYKNWEIIFWDNASTDNSKKIVKSYDEKIKYFYNNNKSILGEARHQASKHLSGDLIAFLDCDDRWFPEKLSKQIEYFKKKKNLGIVYTKTKVISSLKKTDSFVYNQEKDELSGDIYEELLKENFITYSSAMVDKQKFFKVGGFPRNYQHSTDHFIFLELSKSFEAIGINEILSEYRVHENNLSLKYNILGIKEVITSLEKLLPDKKVENGLKFQYTNLIIAYMKEKKFIKGLLILFKHSLFVLLFKRLFFNPNRFIKKLLNLYN